MKRGDCGCRNHLGKPKVKYPTRDAALTAVMSRHVKHGPHRMYECPRMAGVFHVASVRQTRSNNPPAAGDR